jgi:gliding motility-associated-like protein
VNNVTGPVSVFVEGILGGCVSDNRVRATALILPTLAIPVVIVDSVGSNLLRFRWNAVPGATGYQVSTDGGLNWVTPSSGSTGLTHTITGLSVGTTITLRVRALGGCLPAESQPVSGTTVTEMVYIPNAFTPNGDGLNDVLRVYGNFIREMRFAIFNQWGEKIFESRSQNIAWDGTHKGKPQPSGVYMYVCDIILTDGTRIQRKGAINLVR